MAIYDTSQEALRSNNKTLYEVVMLADGFGNPTDPSSGESVTTNIGGSTVFGEVASAETTPVFQLDGLYGISDTNEFQLNSAAGGGQSVNSDGLLTVNSGTAPGGFGALRSKRAVRYRPGQGSMLRFTAMFPGGQVEGYQQVAGYLNQTDILAIGYNFVPGSEFAILRRYKSTAELWELNFTVGTGLSAEDLEITLNGTLHTIQVPGELSAQEVASYIGNSTFSNWIIDYVDTRVEFLYGGPPIDLSDSNFSFNNATGGGTADAVFSALQQGQTPNDTWTYQSDWNLDTLDGNGPSGMILDPSKLNVYQIDFRWLGVGIIRYSIENDITGSMIPFHMERFTNSNVITHISNPSMRAGYAVVNAAPEVGTSTDVTVSGGSMMGAIQGKIIRNVSPRSSFASGSGQTQDDAHHCLTIKNDRINSLGVMSKINQREVIIDLFAAGSTSSAGGVAVTYTFYKNAELVNDEDAPSPTDVLFDFTEVTPGISESKTTGQYKEGTGTLIATFVVASGSTANIDLTELRMILAPLDRLSVFARCVEAGQLDTSVGLTYTVE